MTPAWHQGQSLRQRTYSELGKKFKHQWSCMMTIIVKYAWSIPSRTLVNLEYLREKIVEKIEK